MSDYPHHCGATQAEVERLRGETTALRADLAKAKEEIERLRKRLEEAHAPECSGCGAPVESFTVVCAACSR